MLWRVGVVQYIGEIEALDDGQWYGIEIRMTEGVLGDCDGTACGKSYFKCAPNEGVFVREYDILRRIEPKELLEKVVTLKKIKNSLHRSLAEATKRIQDLRQSPRKRKLRRMQTSVKEESPSFAILPHLFDDHSQGTEYPRQIIGNSPSDRRSRSVDCTVSKYSRFNRQYDCYSDNGIVPPTPRISRKMLSPLMPRISRGWGTVSPTCTEGRSLKDKVQADGNQTDEEDDDLVPSLRFSQCSLAYSEEALISPKREARCVPLSNAPVDQKGRKVWWTGYKRLSHSSPIMSPTRARISMFSQSEVIADSLLSFDELRTFFDHNGIGDTHGFRTLLIDSASRLEPYPLNLESISRCFDEFDITKSGTITVEEFIVVMGKRYLKGLSKFGSQRVELTNADILTYFCQVIRHFMRKMIKTAPQ